METYDMTTEAQANPPSGVPETVPEPEPEQPVELESAGAILVPATIINFATRVREELEWLYEGDDDTPSYLYVQSVIIADSGTPVARLRWDYESWEYQHTTVVDSDGRT